MEVKSCKQCKRLFNYLTGPVICSACKDVLEKKFAEVKAYIQDNPGAGINEVAENMEVSTNQIHRWIREERLSFSEESGVGLDCESCGKLIRSGRLCSECKERLIGSMNNLYPSEDSYVAKRQREAARMRFIDQN